MMLMGASLPTLYAAYKGAQVLVLTDRMVDYTKLQRRVVETAQFVMDVTEFEAFEPEGSGHHCGAKGAPDPCYYSPPHSV